MTLPAAPRQVHCRLYVHAVTQHTLLQDSIAVLDDLLQHALEGLQVKAQLDTGSLPRKAPKQTAMKVLTTPIFVFTSKPIVMSAKTQDIYDVQSCDFIL